MKPPQSKISESRSGLEQVWDIPAKRGVGFLMVFGCFFGGLPLLMIAVTGYLMISGNGETSIDSGWGAVGVFAFLSFFILIGGLVFYFGFKMRYTSYRVSVRNGAVEVLKKFFKQESREKMERGNVHGVGLYSVSETNGKPDYGLLVKAREGEDIKFSNGHKEDELRWLASEMLAVLAKQGGLPTDTEIEETFFSSETSENVKNFTKHGVIISLLGGDANQFVIEKNGSKIGKMLLFSGLFGMIFSSVFIWVGFGAEDGELVFGIVGISIAVVALVMFILGISKLGTAEKYTFKSDVIIKEKLRGGTSKGSTTFQKSSFKKLKVASSGSSNGANRYSVKLVGGAKSLKLFSWVDEDVLEVVKHKVNTWLNPSPAASVAEPQSFSSEYGSPMAIEPSQEKSADLSSVAARVEPHDVPIYSSNFNLKQVKGGVLSLRIGLIIFLLVGLGLTIFGVMNLLTAKESETWPSAAGEIINSKITVDNSGDSVTYGADVNYKYVVDSKHYEGDKVTISEVSSSSRKSAKKIVQQYPVGKKIEVFYNPDNHEKSVLETGITGGSWLLPGLGLAFFIVPLLILIFTEKSYKKGAKSKKSKMDLIQERFGKVK